MPTSPAKIFSSPGAAATVSTTNDDDAQQFQQIIRDRRGKFIDKISQCLLYPRWL